MNRTDLAWMLNRLATPIVEGEAEFNRLTDLEDELREQAAPGRADGDV